MKNVYSEGLPKASLKLCSEMWNADRFGSNTQGAAAPFGQGRVPQQPPQPWRSLVWTWAAEDKTLGSKWKTESPFSRVRAGLGHDHGTHASPQRRPPLTAGRGPASRTARVREGGGGAAPPSRSRLPAPARCARAQRPVLLPPRSALPQPPPNLRVT